MLRKSKKTFRIITLLVLLATVGGWYTYYNTTYLPAQTAVETEPLQTAKVRRGDLIVSASSVGTLVPVQEAAVGFPSNGTLIELRVQPGDVVGVELVLARLDDTEA